MDLVGNVDGSDCIIVDDMIDTAGTLCQAAANLKDNGANRVFAFASHGLFSGLAADRIDRSVLEEVVITNTIPLKPNAKSSEKIKQVGGIRIRMPFQCVCYVFGWMLVLLFAVICGTIACQRHPPHSP